MDVELDLKHGLSKHFLYNSLVQTISIKVGAIPLVHDLRMNTELTLLVCNIVENSVPSKKKIDKEKLVIEALTSIFTLTDEEQKAIKSQIEFLYDNKQIVKIDKVSKFFTDAGAWFVKKFG
jgi:hypothetical protein